MAFAAIVHCCYAQRQEIVESSEDLGHGLRRVLLAEPCDSPGCFEAFTHHYYLFFGDRKLGWPTTYSAAPSGELILYQDGRSSQMMLFRPTDGKLVQLTQGLHDVADTYEWSRDMKRVRVFFLNSKQWKTLKIPKTI